MDESDTKTDFMKRYRVVYPFPVLTVCLLIAFGCQPDLPDDVSQAMSTLPQALEYNRHVKPILSDKCFACHGPDKAKQKAGLRLDLAENAYDDLPESPTRRTAGKVAIDPGNLKNSEVFRRILSDDPDIVMPTPKSHLSLTAHEKAVLVKWIQDGAEYKPHWAFTKPERPDVPDAPDENWVKNPIDNFVAHELAEHQLRPNAEASREILIRRVTLDLTGLPPTLPEIDAFLSDKRANAYEKLVDRLLKSPHYGERMATDWLDLARFADSHGYTVDRIRDMSPYRDWVIKAFNRNQPYDQFIHWQLAGDLMPNRDGGPPTKDMRIATAFNRNHQQNMEGGIIDEEFQHEYVVDRTNTLGDAFLGLSAGCAKCHDHKYDPISQKNYYELSSYFNNVEEAGQIAWDDAMPSPTMLLPTDRQEKIMQFIQTQISQQARLVVAAQQQGAGDFQAWLQAKVYASLRGENIPKSGLLAAYNFEKKSLKSEVHPRDLAYTTLPFGDKQPAQWSTGHRGDGLKLDGDAWLDLDKVGIFSKSDPFSVGLWVNIPAEVKEGVIFHKCIGERLYNFRGYHLYLRNGKLEARMSHVAPSNAITKISRANLPRNQWVQLTMTYDGSGKAAGLRLFMNGAEMPMNTHMDQLAKDILFDKKHVKTEPGLQIGGWWRGFGLKNGLIDEVVVYNRPLTPFEIGVLAQKTSWSALATKTPANLSNAEKTILNNYYFSAIHAPTIQARKALKSSRKALADSTEIVQELMVMQESARPKQAYRLNRGEYDARAEKVYPNTPERIFAFPADLPKNRYGLAQWLTHDDNPLTARVAVNRYWQLFFGTGLVKTTEDFGNQGELPSHPQLLDWLAIEFRSNGWDVKHLVRTIVLSATYRQDSRASRSRSDGSRSDVSAMEQDPQNRLLSRGPSVRLSAEMMRDNALTASGLINSEIGGPSIKPYQPDGLWRINGADYVADSGAKVYKRSLYVLVKRSVPNPTLSTFDASSRSFCVVRRQKTTTPLQALVLLNDPTFVEAAKVLGEAMTRQKDPRQAIVQTYRKLTGRQPSPAEVQLLTQMQIHERERFTKNPAKLTGWLQTGQYRVNPALDAVQVVANAVVASTIMNSDATLTKR